MLFFERKDEKFDSLIGHASLTIVEAMKKIDILGVGILFIVDQNGCLIGCVSDGDIRRWIIRSGIVDCTIEQVINYNPKYIFADIEGEALEYMKKHRIRALPVVDNKKFIRKVICNAFNEVESFPERKSLSDIPVVIMAGGKGTRLYPYTKVLPKPLIPINDKTILERIIEQFQRYGAQLFYIVLNYKKNLIKAYLKDIDLSCDVCFIEEYEELGTGGGLSLLKNVLVNTFVLTNCDILIQDDFNAISDYHKNNKNMITIVSSLKTFTVPYGVIKTTDDGIIETMEEKPERAYLTNTGCYFVDHSVLSTLREKENIGFPDIIKRCQKKGYRIGSFPISEYAWLDMGQMDSMAEMNNRLLTK